MKDFSDIIDSSNFGVEPLSEQEYNKFIAILESSESTSKNPWGVLGFFAHVLGFSNDNSKSKTAAAKEEARKAEIAQKNAQKKELKAKKEEIKAAVITAKSVAKRQQNNIRQKNRVALLNSKLNAIKEQEKIMGKTKYLYTPEAMKAMDRTLDKLSKGLDESDRDEFDKAHTQLILACTKEDGTPATMEEFRENANKNPLLGKMLEKHGVSDISQMSENEYGKLLESIGVEMDKVNNAETTLREKLEEVDMIQEKLDYIKKLDDEKEALDEKQKTIDDYKAALEEKNNSESLSMSSFTIGEDEDKDAKIAEWKEKYKKYGVPEADIQKLIDLKQNGAGDDDESVKNALETIKSKYEKGIEDKIKKCESDIRSQQNLEAGDEIDVDSLQDSITKKSEELTSERSEFNEDELKQQLSDAQKAVAEAETDVEYKASWKERNKELHETAKKEQEGDEMEDIDKFNTKVKKQIENLDAGEIYKDGKRGYFGEDGKFIPAPDDPNEMEDYDTKKHQYMLMHPDAKSGNKNTDGYHEGDTYYTIKRSKGEDGTIKYEKIEIDKETGAEKEGAQPISISSDEAIEIETTNRQAENNRVAIADANKSYEKDIAKLRDKDESTLTEKEKEYLKWYDENETKIHDVNDWADEDDSSADSEDDITVDSDTEGAEDKTTTKDDGTEETEKVLKNPAKVWKKKKNKVTGRSTKNYYRKTNNGDWESISSEEYEKKMQHYKKMREKFGQKTESALHLTLKNWLFESLN